MNTLSLGALLVALGIAQGAIGAHALKALEPDRLGFWTTATQYHLIAALGLMVVGVAEKGRSRFPAAAVALLAGIILFSGSLYVMALGGPRWLGAVTPLGGLALIFGFVNFGISALRGSTSQPSQ